ncbi:MAG: serine hydrolase domain-containing protein [Sphingobacteriales bacterium]
MKLLSGVLASLLFSLNVLSQTLSVSIDSYLQRMHGIHIIPGFSVVVVKDNKVIFSKGYGVEMTGANKPFTPASVIGVGSLTKSFTALAVMKLVEKGKISLDAPIIQYLPWFHTANKEQSDKITIKMLLNNTSGLYAPNTNPSYELSEPAIESFVKNLSSIYLYKEPGNSYEYSNAGFVVAGLVISKVSGISYASFLEKEIFQPIGMKHTSTKPGDFDKMNIAPGHYPSIRSVIVAKREPEFELGEYVPAGSLLHSCADDIGKYLVALTYENGVINRQIKKALWTPYINFPGLSKEDGGDGKSFSYGLGWMISNVEGRNIIHHGGSTGKTSSFTMIDTTNKVAATILMNVDMTFIDKYAYPTEITILNNVLRLANNLPISEFGRPLAKDPTLNNYDLKEDSKSSYLGEYRLSKGGDAWVNFGVDFKIQETAAGQLEGIIYRQTQIVDRFLLDFVNESVAVSRNVDIPGYLKFKLTPGGKVTTAYFNNMEFSKKEKGSSLFREVKDVFGRVSFSIPQEWKYNLGSTDFSARGEKNEALFTGAVLSKEKVSFDSLFKLAAGSTASVKAQSKILSENIGTFIWQQKIYVFKKGDETFQCILFFTKNAGNVFWFMLTTPTGKFTDYLQQVVNPLLKSFRIQ